ncbi:T9SS type A sorting domain-containing protein [Parabacteroides sp. PF5-6]|uniref:T9SS type A sorting domain-containing protein n=1 Tax=Parabacteroides sp. PF5-6 TaxID=1742403 RepID=UPI002405252D|nr:T9SS type A sorting domain-containing protein [Parabacteroides sp. PF5-6]
MSGIQQNYAWLKGEEDSYYGVDGPEGAKTGSLWTGSMSDQPFAGNWNFEDDDSWDFSGADALMPKLKGEMLVKQPDIKNPLKASSETPPSPTYHTITLEVAPGIDLYGMTAGNHQVAENGHLFLQFLPEATTATAADIFFVIDGIETAFNDLGAGKYFSYILNSIKQNHSILIAMKEYAVTLPEVEGVAINVGAGVHQVAYGEKFSFTLTLDDSIDPAKVQVFANGTEIQPDALRATVLSYTIDKVITSIVVVIEGTNTTSNAELTHGMRVVVESGKLKVENGTANAVDVAVYSITGQHMVQLRGLRGSKTITLQPGVYIVRAGTQTWKVMVND